MNEQEIIERLSSLEKNFTELKRRVDTITKFISAMTESQSIETTMKEIESVTKQLTDADNATFYCYDSSNGKFFSQNDHRKWQDTQTAEEIKKIFVGQKVQNREKDKAFIPLINSKGNSMGVIVAEKEKGFKKSDFECFAKGSQITNTVELALQKEFEHQGKITDKLTGLKNRDGLEEHLVNTLCPNLNKKIPASIIAIDVDYFKKINDTYGHPAGDEVLKSVADILKNYTRNGSDCAFRTGGEEMACIVYCDGEKAIDVAEQLREEIANTVNKLDINGEIKDVKATISLGVCEIEPNRNFAITPNNIHQIYTDDYLHADQALYRAKERGRNQVVTFNDNNYRGYIINKTAEVLCGDNKEELQKIKDEVANCLNSKNYDSICNVIEALQVCGENEPSKSSEVNNLIDTIVNKNLFDNANSKLFSYQEPEIPKNEYNQTAKRFNTPQRSDENVKYYNKEAFSKIQNKTYLKMTSKQAVELSKIAKSNNILYSIKYENGSATMTVDGAKDKDFVNWAKNNVLKENAVRNFAPQEKYTPPTYETVKPISDVPDYEQEFETAFPNVPFAETQNSYPNFDTPYGKSDVSAPKYQKPQTYEKKEPTFFNKDGYKDIDNKTFIQTDSKTAYEISKFAQENGVENSAKFQGSKSAVTVDGVKNRGFIEAVTRMSEWADKVQIKAAKMKEQAQNKNNRNFGR